MEVDAAPGAVEADVLLFRTAKTKTKRQATMAAAMTTTKSVGGGG
jgi:hypothetical protein